jgi:hypothetical protein
VSGDRREDVSGAVSSSGSGRGHFTFRVHEAAVAHGCEDCGESEVVPKHTNAQVTVCKGDCAFGPQVNVPESARVFTQGSLALGTAIQVVEDGTRKMGDARVA